MAKILEREGLLLDENGYKLIKKVGKSGENIPNHNHPEANILFAVVKGEVEVFVEQERFIVTPGKLLSFDGNSHIRANMIQDSEIFVTLIDKVR